MWNGTNLKIRRPARILDAKLQGPFQVMKVMTPTALKLELHPQWWIHKACQVFFIEPFRIASNPIWGTPIQYALVAGEHELGYNVEGYEYQTEYKVEEIMGSQFNKEQKKVLYLFKWTECPEETDWTEEPYENFDEKELLRKFPKQNRQAAKDKWL